MSEDLLIVGVILLVVGFAIVPAIVDEVVPPVVDHVLKSVERVVRALVNHERPAGALPAERIKQLEAEVASLSATVQRLAAAEQVLVERVTSEDSGNPLEKEMSRQH